jgi:thiol:disulfide interchange protein DsbA
MEKLETEVMQKVLIAALICLAAVLPAHAQQYVEGKHYSLVLPPQRTSVPAGKIEVIEVFSYGCPGCNAFQPYANKLKAALPANAQFTLLPASWIAQEDWPMFQRAFFAAQALNIVDKTHDQMFNAIWGKSGELAIIDPSTRQVKRKVPTIEDAAKFYERVGGVKAETFVSTANSFGVQFNMKRADDQIKAYKAESTPTIVVNGKYRLTPQTAGGYDETIAVVKFLVAKETR